MKPQVDDIIISANRNIETYLSYAHQVISDPSEGYQGPLAGIAACLPHCKHSYTIVVACDMPELPTDLVSRLSSAIGNNDIAIATIDDHHQLAMLINTRLSDSIRQQLEQGNRRLIQWVKSLSYTAVSFDDEAASFTNINHLSDQDKQSKPYHQN